METNKTWSFCLIHIYGAEEMLCVYVKCQFRKWMHWWNICLFETGLSTSQVGLCCVLIHFWPKFIGICVKQKGHFLNFFKKSNSLCKVCCWCVTLHRGRIIVWIIMLLAWWVSGWIPASRRCQIWWQLSAGVMAYPGPYSVWYIHQGFKWMCGGHTHQIWVMQS